MHFIFCVFDFAQESMDILRGAAAEKGVRYAGGDSADDGGVS